MREEEKTVQVVLKNLKPIPMKNIRRYIALIIVVGNVWQNLVRLTEYRRFQSVGTGHWTSEFLDLIFGPYTDKTILSV